MTTLAVASSESDAQAVRAVEEHHAALAGELAARVAALISSVQSGQNQHAARDRLVAFCRDELLTHAAAEEQTMYPAARADGRARLLVDAMVAEHRRLERLVDDVAAAGSLGGAPAAQALLVLFEEHLAKENELLLPLLAQAPAVSLAALLGGMHELLGPQGHSHPETAPAGAGGCGCGCEPTAGAPELDVRTVPHAIRHATVFGALNAIPAGESLVLVAPHDPVPLLNQIHAAHPGVFSVTYEEPGPVDWRLRLTRSG